MTIKIGELIRATENIKIFKYIDSSLADTIKFAANDPSDYYFVKNDVCTVVGIIDAQGWCQPHKITLDEIFYILLYNEKIWVNLWDSQKFKSSVRVISFAERVLKDDY